VLPMLQPRPRTARRGGGYGPEHGAGGAGGEAADHRILGPARWAPAFGISDKVPAHGRASRIDEGFGQRHRRVAG
jgi:hypothetical protein